MRVNIFGIPHFGKYSKRDVRTNIDRLKRKGLIEKELSGITLSKNGKNYVKKKMDSLKNFEKPKNVSNEKRLIVMFDIPTDKKAEREWLRWHLKRFDYIMIQRSVWVGPAPLPKDFEEYIKKIKLKNCIKTFKLAKDYAKYKK